MHFLEKAQDDTAVLHQRLHVETDLAPASLTARATVAWPQIVASPVLACGAVHVLSLMQI